MKVVSTKKLAEAQSLFPSAANNLTAWYHILTRGEFKSEADLFATFGEVTKFKNKFKFQIPETSLLVQALICFDSQVALIDQIKPLSNR